MSVEIENLPPKLDQLLVNIQLSVTVNVTAFSARQKVTGFVADEISTQMHGGEPVLVMGEQYTGVFRLFCRCRLQKTGAVYAQ